ncbi:MAG: LamG-like jellyroll fold domain-containing protein [Planctomycetota bacterium]|jgi:hypothetical protein
MERFKGITIIVLLASGLFNSAVLAKSASALLQEGLYAEEIEGDLDKAIEIYEKTVEKSKTDRLSAEAMYRLGMCYLKKKDEQRAKVWFEKVIAEHGRQEELIEKVRPLLAELSNPDPASLMPADTKIYVEFGSPGKQIEKILQMLKGTPFENPLAVLGAGTDAGERTPGEKSPGDIMAALFNPSMMAEFKKIRGTAIGITGIVANNPPMVIVLFPGKSDALRGIILAGLGVAGTAGEPIEGMQTIVIGGTAGVAYDDNAIIIGQPWEQLRWVVRQYKGISSEPSLATENKLFRKLSWRRRQENTMTLWLDGAATYRAVSEQMTAAGEAEELALVDGLADLNNLEEVLMEFAIEANEIVFEANAGLKAGHRCLVYNMIRTPNLTREGFEAVPAESIAVASFALGEPDGALAQKASEKIEHLTGLDIGRELFANIEQVNMFVVAPGQSATESVLGRAVNPVVCGAGMAVTSNNPARTRQIFEQLLTISDLVNRSASGEETERAGGVEGRYQIGMDKGEPFYCYMGQAGKSTVLALSEDALNSSLDAVKKKKSVLKAGVLSRQLSGLSPQTSKLLLANGGGVIRAGGLSIPDIAQSGGGGQDPNKPSASELIEQLAKTCDNATVQLRTRESVNNFNLRAGVSQLPAMGDALSVLMQLQQVMPKPTPAVARERYPQPSDGGFVGAGTRPELKWETVEDANSYRIYFGANANELELLAEVRSANYDEAPEVQKDVVYWWRVDAVDANGSARAGQVWSFNTGRLIVWWKFDEGNGLVAADSSGFGRDGTLTNMEQGAWVDGIMGKGLRLDGADDYVSVPALNLNSNTATMAAWINSDARQGESTGIVFCRDGSTTAGVCFGSTGPPDWQPNSQLGYNWNDDMRAWNWKSEVVIPDNKWVFVALVVQPTKATLYLGQDGILSSATNAIEHDIEEFDGELRIGHDAQSVDNQRYLRGVIDDVRIYNYALSQGEIADIYKQAQQGLGE